MLLGHHAQHSTAALLPRGSELSACSWLTCLSRGEKVSTRLILLFLGWSSGASPSSYGYCVSVGYSSSITTSTCLPLFMFLGPLVISVNVRGNVLGQFSSSSHSPWTLPKMQSLEISDGVRNQPFVSSFVITQI